MLRSQRRGVSETSKEVKDHIGVVHRLSTEIMFCLCKIDWKEMRPQIVKRPRLNARYIEDLRKQTPLLI